MKFLTTFFASVIQRFKADTLKPLGRWNIDYCTKKLNKKIDLSNEDHCGPCGQYIISKTTSIKKESITPSEPIIEVVSKK